MEVKRVLHMNGGSGETSYAVNSTLQKEVILRSRSIMEKAITELYGSSVPARLTIVDLGCASGPNTFLAVSELIGAVDNLCNKLGRRGPEFQVFLNDLPGNDFNSIFRSLPGIQEALRPKMDACSPRCYFAGAPGSFYERLFPTGSVHFVHSSSSLHWLSQVPHGLESNKGNIYMANTSPPTVFRAYYEQYQNDFDKFLKCRASELVTGGHMVLSLLGRRSEDPSSKDCCYIWQLLALALNDMVSQGLIEEEKVNAFNLPLYTPSPSEVRFVVEREGSFIIDRLKTVAVDWNAYSNESPPAARNDGYNVARIMRAVVEPLFASLFTEAQIDEVFRKYEDNINDSMKRGNSQFISVIVSLTKQV